jgi:peptidoglycan hydrolase-like protein with peptidoglycan-binding domain
MPARALTRRYALRSPLPGLAWALLRPLFGLVARSPLTITTLALITFGYLWAGTNALFMQDVTGRSSFFPTPESQAAIERALAAIPLQPEAPPMRPRPVDPAPTQSVARAVAPVSLPGEVVGNPDTFRVQTMLKSLGFFTQAIDGYYGPKTADAIRNFEQQAGLTPTGAVSENLIGALEQAYVRGTVRPSLAAAPATPIPQPVQRVASVDPLAEIARAAAQEMPAAIDAGPDHDLVLAVQRGLASLGFLHGPVDGIAGEATAKAVRNFEVFHNYRVTGAVTPELIDMLQAANATF